MSPKKYYYQNFRTDFLKFWAKVPHRYNYVSGEPLFKFAGLVKTKEFDALEDVPTKDIIYFLSALAGTVLIDQVMYTYFKKDYSVFYKMTRYPKMWVGWMNANPWMVFEQNVRLPRKLQKKETVDGFSEFSEFFVKDLKEFIEAQDFKEACWDTVRNIMLNDGDVSRGEFGQIFSEELKMV